MVSWMVNRYCHVGLTNRQVIRILWDKMSPEYKTKEHRELRKEGWREAIETHRENKELFYKVVTGRLGP